MLVRCLFDTTVDGIVKVPGTVVELEDKEARDLIRGRYVEAVESKGNTSDNEDSEIILAELQEIDGVTEEFAELFVENNLLSVKDVANLIDIDVLTSISGIGKATANKIVESARVLEAQKA